jgi:hypothetical protein
MNTRIQLTPTGRARADMLHGVAHLAPCLGRGQDDRPNDNHSEAIERFYPAPRPSVLMTPVAPAAAPGLAPAPAVIRTAVSVSKDM